MTDQEIIYKAIREVVNTDNPVEFAAHNSTCYTIAKYVCEELREKLNSLPAEQPREELEYLATSLEETIGTSPHSRETIISYLQQAAHWQKEQTINNACEWLNKNVVEYHPRKGELRPIVNINAFREAMGKEDEPNRVNIEPPSFEESQGEFNSYNVALNG